MSEVTDSDHDMPEELASLPSFHHPSVSPSGDYVTLYYDITGRNELHVLDIDSAELSQWSEGEVPRNARWYLA